MPDDLTNDEIACLAIMHDGTNMLAIGRWKPAIEALAAKGYARQLDVFNYVATKEGKIAAETFDQSQSDDVLRIHKQIADVRGQARRALEDAAKALVEAANCQNKLTGEAPDKVVWTLGQDIIQLALEYLK